MGKTFQESSFNRWLFPSLSWANILEELLSKDQLVVIDALRIYKKYTDLFDLDAIPEEDIKIAAEQVVDVTLEQI